MLHTLLYIPKVFTLDKKLFTSEIFGRESIEVITINSKYQAPKLNSELPMELQFKSIQKILSTNVNNSSNYICMNYHAS